MEGDVRGGRGAARGRGRPPKPPLPPPPKPAKPPRRAAVPPSPKPPPAAGRRAAEPPSRREAVAEPPERVGAMTFTMSTPSEAERDADDAADETLHDGLSGDLADDAPVGPADRLERSELPGTPGDARDVNRIAMRNAAASTMTESQVPRFAMSSPAVPSEPETLDARSACVLTVAPGILRQAALTWSMS